MNLLIPYVYLYGHDDPLFTEFTYGDIRSRGRKLLRDLKRGDYIFFHTTRGQKRYITAYYVVDRVLRTADAVKNTNIVHKYKNPHIERFLSGKEKYENDVIVFGDPIESRILYKPLPFDKKIIKRLSLGIKFPTSRTETQAITSATRAWRTLSDYDVRLLLTAIESSEKGRVPSWKLISTEEVTEIVEKDLENFLEENSELIGRNLELKGRQVDTPVGRIDLLFEDKKGRLIIAELKVGRIGRDAVNQVRKYIKWMRSNTKKPVSGIVVCSGIMPAFAEDLANLKDVKILSYGWQLKIK
ncbi:MAG: endonuclease NucS [Candidatus Aenigmatarchaeota archaeon]